MSSAKKVKISEDIIPNKIIGKDLKIPMIGLGTWQGTDDPSAVKNAVKLAIDAGYRLFDCASCYGNEDDIGDAIKEKIKEGIVKREDLFIVTKVWNDQHKKNEVIKSCKTSCKMLGLDYLDLYLVHWPFSYPDEVDFIETWEGMEECVNLGITKSIGLSNFNSEQINRLLKSAKIKPVLNQIEAHINLNQKKLREFCENKEIALMAYSPLGAPGRNSCFQHPGPDIDLQSEIVTNIAKKYNKTNAQIALRYLVEHGFIVIPKSSSEKRIKENIDIFNFKLSESDIEELNKLDRGFRTCDPTGFKDCTEYPFNIEF